MSGEHPVPLRNERKTDLRPSIYNTGVKPFYETGEDGITNSGGVALAKPELKFVKYTLAYWNAHLRTGV